MKDVRPGVRESEEMIGLRRTFFHAMRAGRDSYTNGTWKAVYGSKIFVPATHTETWTLVISHNTKPLWTLQYTGWCTEEGWTCLHAALNDAYLREDFRGGRGTPEFKLGEFTYRNEVGSPAYAWAEGKNLMMGREEVLDDKGKCWGGGSYQAMLL